MPQACFIRWATETSTVSDRQSQLDRISPDEDAAGGGGGGGIGILVIATVAGVVLIFSLLTLIRSLSSGNVPPGIVGAGGVFVSFVAIFWVFQRMQSSV